MKSDETVAAEHGRWFRRTVPSLPRSTSFSDSGPMGGKCFDISQVAHLPPRPIGCSRHGSGEPGHRAGRDISHMAIFLPIEPHTLKN